MSISALILFIIFAFYLIHVSSHLHYLIFYLIFI